MNFRALPIRLYTAHAVRLGPCSFWRMEVPTRGYLPRVGALTKPPAYQRPVPSAQAG